jgi:hypothetical protein
MATPFAHKSLSIYVTAPGFPPLPSVLLRTPSLAISIFIIIIINIVIRAEGAQHTTSTTSIRAEGAQHTTITTTSIRAEGAQHTTSTTILTILISVFSIPVFYSTIIRAEGA